MSYLLCMHQYPLVYGSQDFISDRSLCVRVGQAFSVPHRITAGVPQGSHLGPLLFNLSINSLPSVPLCSDLTLFADDSNMICVSRPGTSRSDHHATLQRDVDRCVQWSSTCDAVFNASKCCHVPFRKPRQSAVSSSQLINIGSNSLSQPPTHMHLGVLLTPTLDLSTHVQQFTHKFRGRVFLLSTMARLLPFFTISLLYKAYVRPVLEYAVPIWMFALTTQQAAILDRLQATAARAFLFCKTKSRPNWMTPKQTLNELCNWESLAWRRQILSLVFFHHLFYQYPSLLLQFKLTVSSSSRHPSLVILPRSGAHFSKSPLFLLSIAWNKLPESIRTEKSHLKFRKMIKALYSSHKFQLRGIPDYCI